MNQSLKTSQSLIPKQSKPRNQGFRCQRVCSYRFNRLHELQKA